MVQWTLLGKVIHLLFFVFFQHKYLHAEKMQGTEHLVNCSTKGMLNVTSCNITMETEILDLSFNKIRQIHNKDFAGLIKLKKLLLQFNQIWTIDNDAFHDLSELEYLDISNNMLLNITSLPFHNLMHLKHLDVTRNAYQELQLGVQFADLKELETLYIGNCQITSFRRNDLHTLQTVPLKHVVRITGVLLYYEPLALKIFKNLETLTLEFNSCKNEDLLLCLFQDVSNSSKKLEIRNANLSGGEKVYNIFFPFRYSHINGLVFQNVTMNDKSVTSLLNAVAQSDIKELTVHTVKFNGIGYWNIKMEPFQKITLQKFIVEDIDNPNFFKFYSLGYMSNFFTQLTELSLVKTSVFFFPCEISQAMVNLVHLNLANNLLNEYLLFPGCSQPFPLLQTLNVNNNKFVNLQKLSEFTYHMTNLSMLNADFNANVVSSGSVCNWTISLKHLTLRKNDLSNDVFACLPLYVEYLDLSFNHISQLYNLEKLTFLKELRLTENSLASLSQLHTLPSLKILHIDRNEINKINVDEFKSFNVKELNAANNPYVCDCETKTLSELFNSSTTVIVNWPNEYKCQNMEEAELISLQFSLIQCNPVLGISITVACTLLVLIVIVLLFIKYNGPWYVHTLYLWIRAKKAKNLDLVEKNLEYHAFISYSEFDSSWVKDNLVLQLEDNDPPYQVCIHERDFKPGKPIITNIIDCISKSYKTVFVLSQHFVQSEWCHYEFFFAHHQLFEEKKDSLILLLLEPIPADSIPNRLCKLRKLMNKNTYLEWPQDKPRQSVFWKRLKAVLDIEFKANSVLEHDCESNRSVRMGKVKKHYVQMTEEAPC
ncbi:toll-like receptor 2 type-2 [Protopterus annectens]|uniref:toll-like receptor 2 type-2 n=1 Tax=Protopterus annectens TaxID=7888 RepID=UPI001CF95C54|nr:toll-like receptor 2 type-2 [Protopterus annectens]